MGTSPQPVPGITIAEWTFENGSAADAVTGALPLSPNTSVVQLEDGLLTLNNQGRSDSSGSALIFPDAPEFTGHQRGAGGYVSLALEADVKPSAIGTQMQVIRKTDGDVGYQLFIMADGKVGFVIQTDKGTLSITSKNAITADGQWHHLQAVWDSSFNYDAHLAVDRVYAWRVKELGALTDTEAPLVIGGYYREEGDIGQRFSGEIDNVRISVERSDLVTASGVPLSDPAIMTGTHLTNQPGFVSMEFVYDPPVTPECHAGTLAQRTDGAIVAAWFGGTHEGHFDVGIWESVFSNKIWSAPVKIATGTFKDGRRSSVFNPVLFQYPAGGPMLCFYLSGNLNVGNLMTSCDGGRTWPEWTYLPDSNRGATKNKPVLLTDGTLVCPNNGGSGLLFHRTRDYGKTWLTPGAATGLQAIQPTVLVHPDGKLQALARSKIGQIVETWSTDNGATWSTIVETSLPNNYSGIDAVSLSDGRFLLVYNHVGMIGDVWGKRTPLNLSVSDDGINWSAAMVLEDEDGEYSYPAIIQAADGNVHIIYTWNRIRMKHVVIDPSKLKATPIVNGVWPE